MLKKPLLIFIFFVIIQLVTYGEIEKTGTYQSDTMIANRCIQNCGRILYLYPDSALKYVDTIVSLSKKSNYTYGLFYGSNIKGILSWMKNEPDTAISYYRKALSYADNIVTPRPKAVVLSNIGLFFRSYFEKDSTFKYLNETIRYCELNNVPDIYCKTLMDLGSYYLNLDNYIEASRNLLKARDLTILQNDSVQLVYIYGSLGILYMKVNNFNDALSSYQKSVEINNRVPRVNLFANNYINIGELYYHLKKDYDSALCYYDKAVLVALPYEKNQVEMAANYTKGNVFLEKRALDSTFKYYTKVFTDASLGKYPDREAGLRVNIGKYYFLKKNFKDARHFLLTGYTLSDSLGIITIKGDTPDHHTRLCVSDTGIGIPTDKVPGIFALDADFNRPGTDSEKSSGMGLIMTKEYSDLMGAMLTVASEEGKGSTFCLVFKNKK